MDVHVEEVIHEQQDAGENLDCSTRADAYLGSPFARHSSDLELLQDAEHCYIGVRGDGYLTHSLRRLGWNALPLESTIGD